MNQFKWLNILLGWGTFVIALIVYAMTMEPTASFWDCGEFIASAYKLQVGHPPGAPLFAMLGRLFALAAGGDVTKVAWMINLLSAVTSALTIAFLFWTITALVQKLFISQSNDKSFEWDGGKLFSALGAGFIGAMAYTFSDTFWFSAVEGEVYATSSLFTAVVFWAILKWDQVADQQGGDRWIVLIAYLMGLSVGVHLLNLLTIPAIGLVYYFRKYSKDDKGVVFVVATLLMIIGLTYTITVSSMSKIIGLALLGFSGYLIYKNKSEFNDAKKIYFTLIISAVILLFVQYGIIPGTVKLAGTFEKLTVNGMGMTFGSGFYVYLAILALILGGGIYYFQKTGRYLASLGFWCIVVILIGYSSYGMIILRSKANLPLDENNPENVYSLISYLNREQYGQQPLFRGPFYDAQKVDSKKGGPIYIQAYEVIAGNGGKPMATFTIKRDADEFIKANSDKGNLKIRQRYVINDYKFEYVYENSRMTVFPRMWSQEGHHISAYQVWGKVPKGQKPTMANNLTFFYDYQVGFMYLRYFMWNFAGRESDIQGHGEPLHGNWISGISFLDQLWRGYPQSDLPLEIRDNKGRNKYYLLPLLLGLLGVGYQFLKDRRSWFVTLMLFFFTGIAIVIFLNQNPYQPRERDYAYAGSFYAFCIWIGLGLLGVIELLKNTLKNEKIAAMISIPVLFFLVPFNMAVNNWDDHSRAKRYTSHDFAFNYLNSCAPNAILFTNGDNDTFPLWYLQEVEGVRTDVRIVNLSLLNTDWYVTQMKRAAYDGKPVPFSLSEPEYRQGTRDQVLFDRSNPNYITIKEQMDFLKRTDGSNQTQVSRTDMLYYFKSNKFIIPVDSAKVVDSGIVPKGYENRIQKELKWEIERPYVLKSELMIIDLLSNFNWERPVYFAITVGDRNYLGLEKFFMLDGLAYRLVPFEVKSHDDQTGEVNLDVMYDKYMNTFKWGNMNDPSVYLDETNMRMTTNFRNNFVRLASALAIKGEKEKALQVLNRADELMPDELIPYNYFTLLMADLYMSLGNQEKAKTMLNRLKERTEIEVAYYEKFDNKTSIEDDYKRAQLILQQCNRMLQMNTGTFIPTSQLELNDTVTLSVDSGNTGK